MTALFIRAEACLGSHITQAAKDAETLASRTGVSVVFTFNGTEVRVAPDESYRDVVDRWQKHYDAGREALAANRS